jgi:hypothetical protein
MDAHTRSIIHSPVSIPTQVITWKHTCHGRKSPPLRWAFHDFNHELKTKMPILAFGFG